MSSKENSIQFILRQAYQKLTAYSATPQLDAEVLLAHVLQTNRAQLLAHGDQTLSVSQQQQFQYLIARCQQGEPIAYLLGYREFWSLKFKVTPDTLIPRPETELLVEQILQKLPADAPCNIADLGTGCGAIALAIAHERPRWSVVATDISQAALAVAKQNANLLQLTNVNFKQGNWCDALEEQTFAFHAIVSNPPYIAEGDVQLQSHVRRFEPTSALIAANNGLEALQTIIVQARNYLRPQGWLLLEHGYNQAAEVAKLLTANQYTAIVSYNDLAGWPRISIAQVTAKRAQDS